MYIRPFREYQPAKHLREAEIQSQPSIISMNSQRTTAPIAEPTTRIPINPKTVKQADKAPATTKSKSPRPTNRQARSNSFCIEVTEQVDMGVSHKALMEKYQIRSAQLNYCIRKGRSLRKR